MWWPTCGARNTRQKQSPGVCFPTRTRPSCAQELISRILQADEHIYRQAMQALGLFDVRKRLGEIDVPTLVISGENDTTVPLANQAELTAGIAGARQVIIPKPGMP